MRAEKNMEKLKIEIEDRQNLMEYSSFKITVECDHYLDGKEIVFKPGIR